jgi:C4-dicarboxylate transporter, DctM subunit
MTTVGWIGIGIFVLLMVLVFLGIPIWVSMLGCSFLGFMLIGGLNLTTIQFTQAPFSLGANYTYAVLPLFMLVGSLAGETGIAQGAFDAMNKWFGRVRGGLLYALIGANAVFGACSGISTAGNVVFCKIAMPELEKRHYDRKLSLGAIVGAGSLSSLIPPSVPIIIFCLMTDLSIGTTLMYGLSLGLIMIVLLCLCIKVITIISPKKVPGKDDIEKVPMKEKVRALRYLVPFLLVFALIVGGTLTGLFPSTVAGAVASIALIIYALIKRVPGKRILHCVWDAAIMNAGIFPIIIAGSIFSRFISMTRLADGLANVIANAGLPALAVFTLVVIFYVICGCVMDIASIIIITVPIVFPLLTGLGYNPFVLCVVLVMLCDAAGMTPPIGMNVFAVSNALRTGTSQIFKGVVPFFIVDMVAVFLMGLVPEIVEFLPRLMGY